MKKILIVLIVLFVASGCDNSSESSGSTPPDPPDEICLHTLNAGLSIDGYTGCWGDCPWNQEINCLVVGVYADEDCTELLEAVSFSSPDIEPGEILLSVTREWPDEAWLLFYATDCNYMTWYVPHHYNYYICQGPYKVWFYKYSCGDTLSPFYSGDNNIFDDSCVWGFR